MNSSSFWKNWLKNLPKDSYETVIVTKGNRVNASAARMWWDGETMRFMIFYGSDMYSFIQNSQEFGVSMYPMDDLYPIVRAALLGYRDEEEEFSLDEYEELLGVHVLKDAPASFVASVQNIDTRVVKDDVGESRVMDVVTYPVQGVVEDIMEELKPVRVDESRILISASCITRALFLLKEGKDEKAGEWAAESRKRLCCAPTDLEAELSQSNSMAKELVSISLKIFED